MRPAARPRRRLRERLWEERLPVAICGFAALVYARSLFCGFVRDDQPQIVRNPEVQSWQYLPRLLGSHLWSHQAGAGSHHLFYRPLFSAWMLLVYTVGGLTPWFWHLSSIVLHVAATYLVFRLCLRLTASEPGAAAGAALFAVHPIHVDAVTWVSASNEMLFTIFALGAFLLLLREQGPVRSTLWTSAALYFAALCSKETAIALLPLLAAVAWTQLKSRNAQRAGGTLWKASVPYLTATAVYLLARWATTDAGATQTEHSWAQTVFSAPSIFLFYLRKLFLPVRLSPGYMNAITATPTLRFWITLIAILLAAACIAWIALKRRSLAGLAVAWIALPILPALAVVRLYPQGDITHDRYLYAPSVGLSILAALLVRQAWSRGRRAQLTITVCAAVLIAVLAALTFTQQKYYQDDFAFYRRALEVNPADGMSYSALGDLYLDQGQTDLALDHHRRAHEVAPHDPKVTLLWARALYVTKHYDEAESALTQMLQDPQLDPAHRNSALLSLANLAITRNRYDAAQELLQQVEQHDPATPELHWAMGVLFQREGQLARAQNEYEREFQISGDPEARKQADLLARKNLGAATPALPDAPASHRAVP